MKMLISSYRYTNSPSRVVFLGVIICYNHHGHIIMMSFFPKNGFSLFICVNESFVDSLDKRRKTKDIMCSTALSHITVLIFTKRWRAGATKLRWLIPSLITLLHKILHLIMTLGKTQITKQWASPIKMLKWFLKEHKNYCKEPLILYAFQYWEVRYNNGQVKYEMKWK